MPEEHGETVYRLAPSDPPPDEDFDAIVYDLDWMAAQGNSPPWYGEAAGCGKEPRR